ncbi:VOC family protein [Steroidobacter sp.]|uniref:VOC family protein n=1 Tax=Steroidobacter sp. TaxID=1978227 RepID=UPI001A3BBEDC|nr:VOC family protein [Steroidobacter sp.]MBL8266041.1 VOC family protein [Steroidobacter sp.]
MLRLTGLHHVNFAVRDLGSSERFAIDFGLQVAARTEHSVFLRGAGNGAYLLRLEASDRDAFLGAAWSVADANELQRAVAEYGATNLSELAGPGGGHAVTLTDPEGLPWHLVADIAPTIAQPLRESLRINTGAAKDRRGVTQLKPPLGPPQLLKLGHIGIFIQDFARQSQWLQNVLGLLPSDVLYAGSPDHGIGGFFRLNRGAEWVDHHALAVFAMGKADCHHISFEVQDSEAQFVAHRWLSKQGWEPVWGVGRHPLGSHVFDVWRAPCGYRFETYSDTDLCTAAEPMHLHDVKHAQMDLWSNEQPDRYFK